MLSGNNSILNRAGQARDDTVVGQEKEYVELAYVSAAARKLGTDVDESDMQTELNSLVGANKTKVTTIADDALNVLFYDTEHNYNVHTGIVTRVADGAGTEDEEVDLGNWVMAWVQTTSGWESETYNPETTTDEELESMGTIVAKLYENKTLPAVEELVFDSENCDFYESNGGTVSQYDLYISGTGSVQEIFEYVCNEIYVSGGEDGDYYEYEECYVPHAWGQYAGRIANVYISEGITNVTDADLEFYPNLTTITLPSTVSGIFSHHQVPWYKLSAINVSSNNPYFKSVNGVLYNNDLTEIIRYPNGRIDQSYTILNSVTSIGSCAFAGCGGLSNVTIPSSVTSIGSYAFAGCGGLSTVYINGTSLSTVESSAFNQLANNSKIYVANSTIQSLLSGKYTSGKTTVEIDASLADR